MNMASLRRRRLLTGLALAALAPRLRAASDGPPPEPKRWPLTQATPAINLPTQEGQTWRLASARGQLVLLNFWASWCEPCRSEMPSLELLAQRHERDGLLVQAINFRETDGAVKRYLDQWPISLNILRDRDGAVAQAFGVRIFPTTIVIARDGRAAFSVTGEVDWTGATAQRWIAPLLQAKNS